MQAFNNFKNSKKIPWALKKNHIIIVSIFRQPTALVGQVSYRETAPVHAISPYLRPDIAAGGVAGAAAPAAPDGLHTRNASS